MKLLLLSFAASILAAPTIGPFENHQVLRIKLSSTQDKALVDTLVENEKLGLDVWSHGKDVMDIRVPSESLDVVKSAMGKMDFTVFIENVQKLLDRDIDYSNQLASFEGLGPFDAATLFKDYRSTDDYMDFLLSLQGTTEINIGNTFENRPIRGIRLGQGAKQVVFNGGIHAREWISPATVTFIANFLASSDDRAVKLREDFTFHIFPVLNPDGYEFSRRSSGNRMWRKNREPNQGQSCIGTDINRNFAFKWGGGGSSGSPCADTYRGTAPNSTREAQALIAYVKTLQNVLADDKDFFNASQAAVNALQKKYGTKYTFGASCTTIYQTTGSTDDHMYADGVKYSMTVELRDTGRNGFQLPASQIVPTGEETVDGLVAFWEYIRTH